MEGGRHQIVHVPDSFLSRSTNIYFEELQCRFLLQKINSELYSLHLEQQQNASWLLPASAPHLLLSQASLLCQGADRLGTSQSLLAEGEHIQTLHVVIFRSSYSPPSPWGRGYSTPCPILRASFCQLPSLSLFPAQTTAAQGGQKQPGWAWRRLKLI